MPRVFSGKKVFITGGSSGIGKGLAADLLKRGAHVGIVADHPDKLESARVELSRISPSVDAFVCDVADLTQVRRAAAAFIARCGPPDVLVNNAGYAVYRTVEEMESEELQRLLAVNLVGAALVTREFLPAMIAAGRGHIVMVASIAGRLAMTPCGPYSVAKHGMVALAETLRAELDRFGIRIHVICPGRVLETDFFLHDTFVRRAPRPETAWTVPLERVSRAVSTAIERDRFMTYVPWTYGLLVWVARTFPFLFGPLWRRLQRARVESLYANNSFHRGP